jgi:hypothetical protein
MSTYNDASLIYYPSGYKAGTAYSLKPTDGSGDLTFTRASSATRVNAAGLIETASIIGSELVTNGDFATDTSWTKGTGVTISGGKANWTNTINNVGVTQSGIITSGKNYKVVFTVSNYSSGSVRLRFPLITERLTSNGTYTYYINATDTDLYIQGETNGDANVNLSIDNVSVKEVITSNIPRIDYTGGGCGKLLLEPQRTNVVVQSENLDNGAWPKNNITSINSDFATSPSGATTADKINYGSGNGFIRTNSTLTAASSASIFIKYVDFPFIQIMMLGDANHYANFDIQNGTIGSVGSASTAAIEDYGNGWYRIILNALTGNFNGSARFYKIDTLAKGWAQGGGVAGSFLMWGGSLELGTYPTSYIPTTTTAVTRVSDSATKTGISSLIGQTEGTLFAEVEISNKALGWILDASDGTTTNRTLFFKLNNNQIRFIRNSATQSSSTSFDSSILSLGVHKIALAYQSGNTAFFIDGVQISTTNTATFTNGTLNKISLGTAGDGSGNQLGDRISQALLFKPA